MAALCSWLDAMCLARKQRKVVSRNCFCQSNINFSELSFIFCLRCALAMCDQVLEKIILTTKNHRLKKQWQALVLWAKQCLIQFRIVSSLYLLNSRLGNYQNLSYKQLLKGIKNGKLSLWTHCLWCWCALTTLFEDFFVMLVKLICKKICLRGTPSLGHQRQRTSTHINTHQHTSTHINAHQRTSTPQTVYKSNFSFWAVFENCL